MAMFPFPENKKGRDLGHGLSAVHDNQQKSRGDRVGSPRLSVSMMVKRQRRTNPSCELRHHQFILIAAFLFISILEASFARGLSGLTIAFPYQAFADLSIIYWRHDFITTPCIPYRQLRPANFRPHA
jgi:hypothetical protein